MRTFDLSPLFRSTVGYDRLGEIVDFVTRNADNATAYPPYNIEKTGDDSYRVSIAAAGFGPSDLDVTVHGSVLTVTGRQAKDKDDGKFLHRGIAGRAFQRQFELAEHVRVVKADQENGILNIDLVRDVPEAARPRKIEIIARTDKAPNLIEADAQAA
jgi:molecular chaperone IbpA